MKWIVIAGAILIGALAGCEINPANCVGDPGTVCQWQVSLDVPRRQCTITDTLRGTTSAVYSAAHANGALYCDPQGWRSR